MVHSQHVQPIMGMVKSSMTFELAGTDVVKTKSIDRLPTASGALAKCTHFLR